MSQAFSFEELRDVVGNFEIDGELVDTENWDIGHINDTFFATMRTAAGNRQICLQRINHHVFLNPPLLMENYLRTTRHLQTKVKNPDRNALSLYLTKRGRPYYHSRRGNYWRATSYIDNTFVVSVIEDNHTARNAARAFAQFQKQLVDLPGPRLHETIVGFHYTPGRYEALIDAIESDPRDRAAACSREISFAVEREDLTTVITEAMAAGSVPERIAHNDTKINNVLFDCDTKEAVCVVDLDTLMPGSALYDFGDLVRSSAGGFAENEKDLSKVELLLDRFEALVEGYLSEADFLTRRELDLLAFCGKLITFECGTRFLADYLKGDEYFRIHYPEENLDRCRTQFKLVEEMEKHQSDMEAIVHKHK